MREAIIASMSFTTAPALTRSTEEEGRPPANMSAMNDCTRAAPSVGAAGAEPAGLSTMERIESSTSSLPAAGARGGSGTAGKAGADCVSCRSPSTAPRSRSDFTLRLNSSGLNLPSRRSAAALRSSERSRNSGAPASWAGANDFRSCTGNSAMTGAAAGEVRDSIWTRILGQTLLKTSLNVSLSTANFAHGQIGPGTREICDYSQAQSRRRNLRAVAGVKPNPVSSISAHSPSQSAI